MLRELPPTISIDGAAIRRIREEKKLTQLYVAKVVGVTTDTISRWENNRYPTIKRENVLRLGEALEVPVDQILQPSVDEVAAITDVSELPPRRRNIWLMFGAFAAVGLVLLLSVSIYRSGAPLPPPVVATRMLPGHSAPGNVLPVRVHLDVDSEAKGYILREHFPAGWKLIEANPPPSSLDNEEGSARWIVKPGENRTLITYLLRVDALAAIGQQVAFRGEVVASSEGQSTPITVAGDGQLTVAPFLWADLDGDGTVSDGEMLEASDAVEEMSGVHIDWKQLESLWDAGRYRWDAEKQQFLPVRAHPSPPPH